MDEEGYLYFVSRKDDIIKTRGEKVSPKEVENVLYGIPGIVEATVLGVPDEILGQAIKALVVLGKGVSLTEQEILQYCGQNLEDMMVPKYVEICTSFPKTDTGKIKKASLPSTATTQK
jgi:acyl-coenzyme A synthetase/AMP-(fatty) acid ligase